MAKSDSHKIPKWLKLEEGEEYVRGFRTSSEEVIMMILLYSFFGLGFIWIWSMLHGTPLKYPPLPLAPLMLFYAIRLIIFYMRGCLIAHLTSNNIFVTNNHSLTLRGFAIIPLDSVLSVQFAGRPYEYGTVRIIYNRKGKRRRYNVSIEDYEGFIKIVSARITSSPAQGNSNAKECSGNA